ncbi:MAG: thioredoxin domain-containing protein [Alphaproteobacteria bacterium]|nr:thioredoxin domain-containing protein [Alphaproteobacteria bacterium]
MNKLTKFISIIALCMSGYALWKMQDIKNIILETLREEPEKISQVTIEGFEKMRQKSMEDMQLAQQRKVVEKQADLVGSPNTPFLGKADAPIVVSEFLDFRCGHCRSCADSLAQLLRDNPDVRINIRFLPILGDESAKIALYAMMAHKAGKFPEFYKKMMASVFPDDVAAEGILAAMRIKTKTPEAKKQQTELSEQIINDTMLAQELEISATPCFILGDKIIVGAQIKSLADAIQEARNPSTKMTNTDTDKERDQTSEK